MLNAQKISECVKLCTVHTADERLEVHIVSQVKNKRAEDAGLV